MLGYAIFDTAIGRVGLAWSDRGLRSVQLPEADEAATVARLRRRAPGAQPMDPPPVVREAIAAITALLAGAPQDLTTIPLDEASVPYFHRRVYAAARAIPPGRTLTYGAIATRLGAPGSAQAVGQALGANPWPLVVPCHRVLPATGGMGGFSAPGGAVLKRRLLAIEGWHPDDSLSLFAD